jgi:CDP-glucose 4,6-dehydratase
MESLSESFSGKRVFVTGHSGFKGSWLCAWLLDLGADVTGYSLAPPTKPALFTQLKLATRMNHIVGDVRNAARVSRALSAAKPDYVFHLAAQPIVQSAHDSPVETWSTNVMGTVNTLDALRRLRAPCAAVVVTTDKVYARQPRPQVELNSLGGTEPYGASKAAVELAVEAWRASFFPVDAVRRGRFPHVAVATARSGNVIGGGDWAIDRLVPDIARALGKGRTVVLRNPSAIRPWQHVLDPLSGYLILAARLRGALTSERARLLQDLSGPFNFGPSVGDHRTVRQVTEEILKHWPGKWSEASTSRSAVEVEVLRLDSGKARKILGWRPKWSFEEAVSRTVEWYRMVASSAQAELLTARHLAEHQG